VAVIHLALNIAAFLFLAFVGIVVFLILSVIILMIIEIPSRLRGVRRQAALDKAHRKQKNADA